METATLIPIALVLVVSALLVITGLKKAPGIGVIGAVVAIGISLWLRGRNLASLGFFAPDDWGRTLLLALLLGVLIQFVSILLIEPLSEKLTHTAHDFSVLDKVKGNWLALLQWLLMVWILVAFLEESVYRGFLMTEIREVLGSGALAVVFNVLFTSMVFGLSHGYQGRSGIISTALVGILLALLFVWSGYNLWLPILTHGIIDTVGIGLISIDGDKRLRQLLWKEQSSS
jgi:membrane protease YdiL (CAAX protease family)